MSRVDIKSVLKPSAFNSIKLNNDKHNAYRPKSQLENKKKSNYTNTSDIQEPSTQQYIESSKYSRTTNPKQNHSRQYSVPKKFVDNINGQAVDKLTRDTYNPSLNPFQSIYGKDFNQTRPQTKGSLRGETQSLSESLDLTNKHALKFKQSIEAYRDQDDTHSNKNSPAVVQITQGNESKQNDDISPQKQFSTQSSKKQHFQFDEEVDEQWRLVQNEKNPFEGFQPHKTINDIQIEKEGLAKNEYFDYALCNLIKGKCSCGKCFWPADQLKAKFRIKSESIYQKDYDRKNPLRQTAPNLTMDLYSTFVNNEPMNYDTTMKSDFKPFNIEPKKNDNDKAKKYSIPFMATSSYQKNFVNWGPSLNKQEKSVQHQTVISDLPFLGRTSYADNFGRKSFNKDENPFQKGVSAYMSPFSPVTPFIGESNYQSTYKPFKISQNGQYTKQENESEKIPGYPGQFTSEMARKYTGEQLSKCPAREIIEKLAVESTKAKTVLNSITGKK